MRPASDLKQQAPAAGPTGLDWRLHAVMADRGIKFAKDLQDALARDGYPVSASSISRLVYQEPKQLDIRLLSSLCRVLGCTPDELLVPRRGNPNI
jgi:DNA-binding Xre family transcriptional regulator